jgi:uncharacterized protein
VDGVKDKADKDRWAEQRFQNYKMDGVYVVFCKSPKFYRIEVGNKTTRDGYFTAENLKKLKGIIEAKQPSDDDMLTRIADYTRETMDIHPPVKKAQKAEVPVHNQPVHHNQQAAHPNTMPSWVPWVCTIVGILLVVWVIFAIIRAMTGMMGGGYGPGYGGGYGGGGGFFTGMLGGLFGAMAGMWIYNNLFGGHATYGPNGTVNWDGGAGDGSSGAGYQGDTGVGASEGGDDWGGGGGEDAAKGGDDAGGWGDDGGAGGGGDDGGGGWFGGGGDAGGGGGDWGGGGGGDWGGGGGGDFGGGGGGDW